MKSILIVVAFMVTPFFAFAEGYQPLAPVPGATKVEKSEQVELGPYMKTLYNFGIGIAAALAVIMVIWGGIEYMTTDAIGHHEEGKQKIQSAILGLLLALSSYIILQTINRDLLNVDFTAVGLGEVDEKYLKPAEKGVLGTQNPMRPPAASTNQGGGVQPVQPTNDAYDPYL